jgi:hypothetical protein
MAVKAPALKAFPSRSLIFAPHEWLAALGARPHIQQCYAFVAANSKAHACLLLEERDLGARHSASLVSGLQLRRGAQSTDNQALIDAGVISLEVPGVYAFLHVVKDAPVIRIDPGGECVTVAHFRYTHTDGITVDASG